VGPFRPSPSAVPLPERVARYFASDALWKGSSMRDGSVELVGDVVVVTVLVVDVDVAVIVEAGVPPATVVDEWGCCAL